VKTTVIAGIYVSYFWDTDLSAYDVNITPVQTGPTQHILHGTNLDVFLSATTISRVPIYSVQAPVTVAFNCDTFAYNNVQQNKIFNLHLEVIQCRYCTILQG